jgi:uncharacterized protein (DUF2141 family)
MKRSLILLALFIVMSGATALSQDNDMGQPDNTRSMGEPVDVYNAPASGNITVSMVGFRNNVGKAQVAIFKTDEGFPFDSRYAFMTRSASISGEVSQAVFKDVPTGTYAISVFHDEDSDADFDRNWIFLPAEGYGTSNNAGGYFGPGNFRDSVFILDTSEATVGVIIHY